MTSPNQPGDAAPPSLLAASRPDSASQPDGLRMLSGLDRRRSDAQAPAGRSRKGLFAGVICAAALAGLASWWALSQNDPSSDPGQPPALASAGTLAGDGHNRAAEGSITGGTPGTPVAAAVSSSATLPASSPAAIEVVNSPFAALVDAPQAAASSTLEKLAAAAPASAVPATANKAARPAAHASKPAAKPPVANPRVAANSAAPSRSKPDSDVELLTAMVAHLEDRTVPAATEPASTASASRTIAQLVRSCKKLADKDFASCRERICEGYWGKALACPARLQPAAQRQN